MACSGGPASSNIIFAAPVSAAKLKLGTYLSKTKVLKKVSSINQADWTLNTDWDIHSFPGKSLIGS